MYGLLLETGAPPVATVYHSTARPLGVVPFTVIDKEAALDGQTVSFFAVK